MFTATKVSSRTYVLLSLLWTLVPGQAQTISRSVPASTGLEGTWEMVSKGGGVEASISFLTNGSYRYRIGIDGVWKLEHEGKYAVKPSHLAARKDWILTLTPTKVISEPTGRGQEWLRTRYMMDNKTTGREYWFMPETFHRVTLCESPYGDVTCASAWTLLRR
jgi:hypothetical protein